MAALWFGVVSVSGVGAKPPELPNKPDVECKVLLFPLGEVLGERSPPEQPPMPVPAPEVERLEVLPCVIEALTVSPRPEETALRLKVIESPDTRRKTLAAFPARDPESPCRFLELFVPVELPPEALPLNDDMWFLVLPPTDREWY